MCAIDEVNRPAVFVPEADNVSQLVYDDAARGAVSAECYFL